MQSNMRNTQNKFIIPKSSQSMHGPSRSTPYTQPNKFVSPDKRANSRMTPAT